MYPTLPELRALEKDTLQCLSEMGEFARLGQVQQTAKEATQKLRAVDRGAIDVHFNFTLDIRIKGIPAARRIDLGALVRADTDQKSLTGTTYSVIICTRSTPGGPILRKFHFDYEPIERRNAAEPKPSVHFQVCGKLSAKHIAEGYKESRIEHLYPHFEKPRVPCQPTSIALLLNWLLLEFQNDSVSQSILKNPRWRKLVANAERTVVKPYFDAGLNFLQSAGNSGKPFLQAFLYQADVS
jgi:hypothetical protein